jgi:hypothetical protein
MKPLPIACAFLVSTLLFVPRVQAAAVLIDDFSAFAANSPVFDFSWSGGTPVAKQYVQDSGFISIAPVNGGTPQDDGNFFVAPALWSGGIDLSSGGTNDKIALTARFDAGNLATNIVVIFTDSDLNAASATFTGFGSTFSTQSISMASFSAAINWASVIDWTISGGAPVGSDAFRASFTNIEANAVPEPTTWALLAAGLTTVMIFRRRRSKF